MHRYPCKIFCSWIILQTARCKPPWLCYQGSELHCKFSPAIQLLKNQLPNLKLLSNNELLLLYTWRYTRHVIKLYYRSVHDTTEKAFQYFHPKELEFIKPTLSGNVGNILLVPDILVELKKQQKQARATYRYSELLDHKASNKRKFSPSALHKICKECKECHPWRNADYCVSPPRGKEIKLQIVEANLMAKPITHYLLMHLKMKKNWLYMFQNTLLQSN